MKQTILTLLLLTIAAGGLWITCTRPTTEPEPFFPDPAILFPDSAEVARRTQLHPIVQYTCDMEDFLHFAMSDLMGIPMPDLIYHEDGTIEEIRNPMPCLREESIVLDTNPMPKIRGYRRYERIYDKVDETLIKEIDQKRKDTTNYKLYPFMHIHGKDKKEVMKLYANDELIEDVTDTLRYGMTFHHNQSITVRFMVSHLHYAEVNTCSWKTVCNNDTTLRSVYFIRDGDRQIAFWGLEGYPNLDWPLL